MSKPSESERDREAGPGPAAPATTKPDPSKPARPDEIGGPAWPEPTRYGDWERAGRVSDF
jgi:homeobox protein ESX1